MSTSFTLTSAVFSEGSHLDAAYRTDRVNQAPAVQWQSAP